MLLQTFRLSNKKKLLSLINEQSEILLSQVGSILDAAKLDSGQFTIHKQMGDFDKLLSERVEFFKPQAASKNIVLKAEIDPNIPHFEYDPIRLSQVINNLLSNSLKFTNSGGTITLRDSFTPDKSAVMVSVTDTGTGIPQDKQSQLFSRFSQVNGEKASMGTGLGLYVVKGIVEAHKGTIRLESEVGHGTTISFIIPIALPAQAATAPLHATLPN